MAPGGDSLVVHWLGLGTFIAGGWGTKILKATRCSQNIKNTPNPPKWHLDFCKDVLP